MYVSRVQGFRAPTTVSRIGVRLPAHLTATGRSLLAALPASQVTALYPHRSDLVSRGATGPRSRGELDRILDRSRADGWSRENGDITADFASVGAAVLDRNDYPTAAVGLTFRGDAAGEDDWLAIGVSVRDTAAALRARLIGR